MADAEVVAASGADDCGLTAFAALAISGLLLVAHVGASCFLNSPLLAAILIFCWSLKLLRNR